MEACYRTWTSVRWFWRGLRKQGFALHQAWSGTGGLSRIGCLSSSPLCCCLGSDKVPEWSCFCPTPSQSHTDLIWCRCSMRFFMWIREHSGLKVHTSLATSWQQTEVLFFLLAYNIRGVAYVCWLSSHGKHSELGVTPRSSRLSHLRYPQQGLLPFQQLLEFPTLSRRSSESSSCAQWLWKMAKSHNYTLNSKHVSSCLEKMRKNIP